MILNGADSTLMNDLATNGSASISRKLDRKGFGSSAHFGFSSTSGSNVEVCKHNSVLDFSSSVRGRVTGRVQRRLQHGLVKQIHSKSIDLLNREAAELANKKKRKEELLQKRRREIGTLADKKKQVEKLKQEIRDTVANTEKPQGEIKMMECIDELKDEIKTLFSDKKQL